MALGLLGNHTVLENRHSELDHLESFNRHFLMLSVARKILFIIVIIIAFYLCWTSWSFIRDSYRDVIDVRGPLDLQSILSYPVPHRFEENMIFPRRDQFATEQEYDDMTEKFKMMAQNVASWPSLPLNLMSKSSKSRYNQNTPPAPPRLKLPIAYKSGEPKDDSFNEADFFLDEVLTEKI